MERKRRNFAEIDGRGNSVRESVFSERSGFLGGLPSFHTRTVLLDSSGPGQFGGTGRSFPWEIARRFIEENPHLQVVLAGGLTPENVGQAIAAVRPFGVDVTTGVENAPGRKDYDRLRAFISAARAA
jgi:Phosphoribosylanthranilate isomerase